MTIYVFARTKDDADQWAKDYKREDYRFVSDTKVLRGRTVHPNQAVFLDGFFERKDHAQLMNAFRAACGKSEIRGRDF